MRSDYSSIISQKTLTYLSFHSNRIWKDWEKENLLSCLDYIQAEILTQNLICLIELEIKFVPEKNHNKMEKVCVERTLWMSKFSLKTGWGKNPFLNYHFDQKATVSTFFY